MLRRYLLRETLGLYTVGILIFMGLLTTDLLSSLSGVLLRQNTPLSDVLQLVVYRLPYTLGIALPLGLVFSLLVTLSRWIRQSELKAAYAGGIPPRSLLWPALLLGVVVSGVALWNEGWVKPEAQARFDAVQYRIYYGSQLSGVLSDKVYAPEGLGVYYAQRIYPDREGARLEGVRVIEPGGAIWSADRGRWLEKSWQLQNAYRVDPDGKVTQVSLQPLPFPARFVPQSSSSGDLTLRLPDLHAAARVDPSVRFTLARTYANALGALVLAWLAIVVGLSLRESAWAFISIVALIFGYWVLWTASAQFAKFDVWGAYGAWLPNLVYAALAAWGTVRLLR